MILLSDVSASVSRVLFVSFGIEVSIVEQCTTKDFKDVLNDKDFTPGVTSLTIIIRSKLSAYGRTNYQIEHIILSVTLRLGYGHVKTARSHERPGLPGERILLTTIYRGLFYP